MKKTLITPAIMVAIAVSASAATTVDFQFGDATGTGLQDTVNSGDNGATWNFNIRNDPGTGTRTEGATDGGALSIGHDTTAGSSPITTDYTRKADFASTLTSGTYVLEYSLENWNIQNTATANGATNNAQGITIKLVGTGGTINLATALNSSNSNTRARHSLSGLTGTAAQTNIGNSGSDLIVRIAGNLNTGAFTTSVKEGIAAWNPIITNGAGMTDISSIYLTIEGGVAWADNDHMDVDYITLDVVPEPSSTALLGLGGLALMLRRRR